MNTKFAKLSLKALLMLAVTLSIVGTALAVDSPSPVDETTTELHWTGQGTTGGELDTELCGNNADFGAGAALNGATEDSYLLWIFTTDGGSIVGSPTLTVNNTDYAGAYSPGGSGTWQIVTPYIDPITTAYVTFEVDETGNGAWVLTISHGCAGDYEELTVSKTVETSYTRTHEWSIDKSVDTEYGYEHEGYPKVWLYIDGSGDETATWTVDVTYEGYDDDEFNVSGEITIENTGTLDAYVTDISDLLAGTSIPIDCGTFTVPGTIAVGDTVTCTYDEDVDRMIEGSNVVTVTTVEDIYSDTKDIVWGDPTTEYYKTVNVQDISDLFGTVDLGTVTAPNDGHFTYTKDFAWADYGADGCGDFTYDNTAEIVETGQTASATLKVNVQCYVYETAYAKGSNNCFIPDFDNWGWSNKIGPGEYEWPLWAGAGQCDTSKGTLVGTVTVVYSGGTVTVTYNVNSPYLLDETHVYAGYTEYPLFKGKSTVAPGKYYNNGSFSGEVYVIAHAVVGLPDPNFGP